MERCGGGGAADGVVDVVDVGGGGDEEEEKRSRCVRGCIERVGSREVAVVELSEGVAPAATAATAAMEELELE